MCSSTTIYLKSKNGLLLNNEKFDVIKECEFDSTSAKAFFILHFAEIVVFVVKFVTVHSLENRSMVQRALIERQLMKVVINCLSKTVDLM